MTSKRKQRGREADEPMRLQKRLAHLGVASRREAERMIQAGRVAVNGAVVTRLGTRVSSRDRIAVDGATVGSQERLYVMLFKPDGVLCTRMDPQGRSTIYELLPDDLPYLAHVGRLDYRTEGLLLLTNDGDLAAALMSPASAVPRVYHVKIRGRLSRAASQRLEAGIPLAGRPTRPVAVERLQSRSKHDWLRVTLFEGKNRHVHRIIEAVGSSVTRLRRVELGPLTLAGLAPGEHRLLEPHEVSQLRALV